MAKFKIEGLDDCLSCMDAAPGNVKKITKTALREAAKVTRRQIKMATPKRYQRLSGFKLKTVNGEMSLWIGLFQKDGQMKPGAPIPDWFKAYWKNYGTLKHRDPSHKFKYPIRTTRKKRNWEGQPHENFFEGAIAGWEGPFMEAFERAMQDQQEKLYDR
jgi:hypothetical protein